MKAEDKNTGIEGLFRNKLRDYQYSTSSNFWLQIERKLRFREFFKFRPWNFNAYYLGAIITAAVVSVSVLLTKDNSALVNEPDLIVENAVTSLQIHNDVKQATDSEIKQVIEDKESSSRADVIDGTKTSGIVRNDKEADIKSVLASFDKTKQEEIIIDLANSVVKTNSLVKLKPVAEFRMDRNSGCVPLSISFENVSSNLDSCLWVFSDGGISSDLEPVWIFDEEGVYEISLIAFGNNAKAIQKATVNVYAAPVASFELSAGDPYLPDEQVIFYNYSDNSVAWEWDFGDGTSSNEFEPAHFYKEYGSYTIKLKAFSEDGCVDSMIITDAFGFNSCYIEFPNAFIPNDGGPTGGYYSRRSDEQNEVFHPVWSGVTKYHLRIFSRQGMLVFETNDLHTGWDGYYKGQKVEPGVYIWKVRGVFNNGDYFIKGGDLTLIPKW